MALALLQSQCDRDATGAQIATPGQAFSTEATQIGSFSLSQENNPATGLPYSPDKAGKDNNFRGLTIYNNTMYVTKGSGSNGVNTVYQVGDKGTLPTVANASSAALTILPGFPIISTKAAPAAQVTYPFGLFFANATTLYVSDEGDGVLVLPPPWRALNPAGIGKWVLQNGTWTRVYTLQAGLNLGQPYSVTNYPTSIQPATGGVRNITGKINGDGTVTLFGITSTVSTNGDPGADPNELVSITDTIAGTTAPAGEKFTILETAPAGTVLRGVSLTPTAVRRSGGQRAAACLGKQPHSATSIAPGSLATANGQNLATGTAAASGALTTSLSGATVSIVDGQGATTQARLLSVSPNQIEFVVPATAALGTAQVIVNNGSTTQTANNVQISETSPGLFTAHAGSSLATGYVVQVNCRGEMTDRFRQSPPCGTVPAPIALSSTYNLHSVLLGTGFAAGGTALTTATINGVNAPVSYAGPEGTYTGLDQINILIPASLAGKGWVNVQVTGEGVTANNVQITIQ